MSEKTSKTDKRHSLRPRVLAFLALGLGVVFSVMANVKHAEPYFDARLVSAFPPVALLLCVELMTYLPRLRGWYWHVARWGGTGAVAVVCAIVSYKHQAALFFEYGEDELSAAILPLAIDGLMLVASVTLLAIGKYKAVDSDSDKDTVKTDTLPDDMSKDIVTLDTVKNIRDIDSVKNTVVTPIDTVRRDIDTVTVDSDIVTPDTDDIDNDNDSVTPTDLVALVRNSRDNLARDIDTVKRDTDKRDVNREAIDYVIEMLGKNESVTRQDVAAKFGKSDSWGYNRIRDAKNEREQELVSTNGRIA